MVFNDVIEKIGMIIDAAGVVVIVTGVAIAFVAGDIVRTVAASPSLTSVAIMAVIVVIRTHILGPLEDVTVGARDPCARRRSPQAPAGTQLWCPDRSVSASPRIPWT